MGYIPPASGLSALCVCVCTQRVRAAVRCVCISSLKIDLSRPYSIRKSGREAHVHVHMREIPAHASRTLHLYPVEGRLRYFSARIRAVKESPAQCPTVSEHSVCEVRFRSFNPGFAFAAARAASIGRQARSPLAPLQRRRRNRRDGDDGGQAHHQRLPPAAQCGLASQRRGGAAEQRGSGGALDAHAVVPAGDGLRRARWRSWEGRRSEEGGRTT